MSADDTTNKQTDKIIIITGYCTNVPYSFDQFSSTAFYIQDRQCL